MDVKAQVQLLMMLNETDLQIDDLQRELQQIPNREREDELELIGKKTKFESLTQEISELEKKKLKLEQDIQASQDHLADFQSKLSMIKTNKEYQAALKEVDENKKLNKQREDQILEIIQKLETLTPTTKEAEEFVHGSSVAFEARKKELEAERLAVMDRMGTLVQKREQTVVPLEARFLTAYQRIRKQKTDAVVPILNGACHGCHMKIAPQMRLDMQKITSLFTCPTCHRILCLPEWEKKEVV